MQLLISCPNCHTSYKIDEEQILKSDGQARCYQCNNVFNARLNAQPLPEDGTVDHLNLPDSADLYDQPSGPLNSEQQDLADREMSSLFAPEQHSEILTGPDDAALQDSSVLLPEELLDIDSDKLTTIEPLKTDNIKPAEPKSYSVIGTLFWTLLVLMLVAIFLAQIAWVFREQLLANPQARSYIEEACKHSPVPCDLPPRRAPQSFEIIERHVSTHPKVDGILSVSMLFTNQADFAQPAPGITLSLFDAQQQLIARRSFSHKDYLDDFARKAPMLEAGHRQKVFLNLEDPGTDVTGFEFNFY